MDKKGNWIKENWGIILLVIIGIVSGYIFDWDWRCILTDKCYIIKP
jgi:hypothetical protein